MSLRKFSAESLFDGRQFIRDAVLITDDYGIVQDIVDMNEAGGDVQCFNGMLVPGFINAHCHLELSHMKGKIKAGCGFVPFLKQVVASRSAAPDNIAIAMEQTESAMVKEGIVAVGDICNTTDTIVRKTENRLYYHSFIEAIGFDDRYAASIYAQATILNDTFASYFNPESISITPHAPYSVSNALFNLIAAKEQLISLHNQEDEAENLFFQNCKGPLLELYHSLKIDISNFRAPHSSSLQAIWKHFHKNQKLLLVHNVATSAEDIVFISDQADLPGIYWCVCPNANLYITGNLPDVGLLMQHGKMVLGTDSLASNHQLSILEEMKTLQKNFSNVSLQQLLQWATINGAEALHIENRFGSFEKGKQPGVVLIQKVEGELLQKAIASRIV